MKIAWNRKLTSRKFWAAVAGFVSGCFVAFGGSPDTVQTIVGVVLQGASVVAYIIGEGLADSANGGDKSGS